MKRSLVVLIVSAIILLFHVSLPLSKDKAITAIKEMVYIPEGEFVMGRGFEADYDVPSMYDVKSEEPAHKVVVEAFYMDKYEVTNEEYAKFVAATKRNPPTAFNDPHFNNPKQPVVTVTWEDAKAYCEWKGKRLPTEAEWEKAARGVDARRYPWGNVWDPAKVNYGFNDDGTWAREPMERKPMSVGTFPSGASPYGIMDMCGNVWEWTSSLYKPYPYKNGDGRENLKVIGERVVRGGAYDSMGGQLIMTYRDHMLSKDDNGYDMGFRCAKSAENAVKK